MSTFERNRVDELPAIFNGPIGQALARALGRAQDREMELFRQAALARFPFWCEDDALDAAGTWFRLSRFKGEINGTAPTVVGGDDGTGYRGRLCAAWPTWKIAGSKGAIIKSLNAWGLPDVVVENDYQISPPYPGSWYSRFRVKVGPSFGAFGWGPGNDPTAEEQRQMAQQALFWKWTYGYLVEFVLDDGAGYTFTITVGPLIGHGFVIGTSHIGGYDDI